MNATGGTHRWVYQLPRVAFSRSFTLGSATFRPAGQIDAEVHGRRSLVDESEPGHLDRWEHVANVVGEWDSATVEVEAVDSDGARRALTETMGVFRFLMRGIVTFNVDIHRIGVVGEVDHRVLDYVVLARNGVVAAGWSLEDSPVNFTFTDATLDGWAADSRIAWLHNELVRPDDRRTVAGRRAITALGLADSAFLSRDPLVRILFSAVAVESMFSAVPEVRGQTSTIQIARRVAYLTCPGHGAGDDTPLCPYIAGLDRHRDVVNLAVVWSEANRQWQCSPFLEISTPVDLEPYRRRPSLFSARNEIAHEGRTSADQKMVGKLRWTAEKALEAGIGWFASHPGSTIADLDDEIAAQVKRRGVLRPEDVPESG